MRAGRLGAGLLLVGVPATALAGCSDPAAGSQRPGTVDVVASTDVWGSVASAVGGRWVSVTSIIANPDEDPHSFEASARTLLLIRDASLVLTNGGGYDDFMDRLLTAARPGTPVLDAVTISAVPSPHGQVNEHVWYDFPAVKAVAGAIAERLSTLAPAHAADFTTNLRVFDRQLERLIGAERRVAATHPGVGVAVTEPLPDYLLEAMGLPNLTPVAFSTAVEDGDDVSPLELADTLALFAHHRVAALVYDEQTTGPLTQQVEDAAVAAGVPVVPVTETLPAGATYLSWMRSNVARVTAAVSAR